MLTCIVRECCRWEQILEQVYAGGFREGLSSVSLPDTEREIKTKLGDDVSLFFRSCGAEGALKFAEQMWPPRRVLPPASPSPPASPLSPASPPPPTDFDQPAAPSPKTGNDADDTGGSDSSSGDSDSASEADDERAKSAEGVPTPRLTRASQSKAPEPQSPATEATVVVESLEGGVEGTRTTTGKSSGIRRNGVARGTCLRAV